MNDRPAVGEIGSMIEQGAEQARKAIDTYLEFIQKSVSGIPFGKTDLNKKILSYAGKSSAQAFEYATKLARSKDFAEAMKIQMEFLQAQMNNLNEQTKEISETAAKTMGAALKNPFGMSS